MSLFPPTLILRHRKENLKKCSLRNLENRSDFRFYTFPWKETLPDLSAYVVLDLSGPPLSSQDRDKGLFLIDATWRYAKAMSSSLQPPFETRSLPAHYRTAYPRKQTACEDPERGLASIEALYLAYCILGRNPEGLLDHYHWKTQFLENFVSLKY